MTRPSAFLLVSVAVATVGLVLAIVGLAFGGDDQGSTSALRRDVSRAEQSAAAARADLRSTAAGGAAYAAAAGKLLNQGADFCACGQRSSTLERQLNDALTRLVNDPESGSASDAYNAAVRRANAAGRQLKTSLRRLRDQRRQLPEPPAG